MPGRVDRLAAQAAGYGADMDNDGANWAAETAERLQTIAAQLAEAVLEHARAAAAMSGQRSELVELIVTSEALARTAVDYAHAQLDHTGNGYPFGVIEQYLDTGSHDDEDEDDDGPVGGFSVLRRQDYVVTEEAAVLASGRAAYLVSWPDDTEDDAAEDVNHLGRALYQVAHAHGWDALTHTSGLSPTGAVTAVVPREDVLRGDTDDWPEDPFTDPGDRLYQEDDVWFT